MKQKIETQKQKNRELLKKINEDLDDMNAKMTKIKEQIEK